MASPLRASRAASASARIHGRLRGRPFGGEGRGASELLGSGLHEESRGGGGGGGNDDDVDAAMAAAELEQQQRDGASRPPPDFDDKRVRQVLHRAGAVRLYTPAAAVDRRPHAARPPAYKAILKIEF